MPHHKSNANANHTSLTRQYTKHSLLGLLGVILSVWLLEYSPLDVMVSRLFYINNHWLIAKDAILPDLLFYKLPKYLCIALELVIIISFVICHLKHKHNTKDTITCLGLQKYELGYLALSLISTPTLVAIIKTLTHTPCPAYLSLFGGTLPYLSIIQNIQTHFPAKCFPAAHASTGFALYAFAFLPKLKHHRIMMISAVSILAWIMGIYKMAIGDHFLSHTVVSMCLAWSISAYLARQFFVNKHRPNNI